MVFPYYLTSEQLCMDLNWRDLTGEPIILRMSVTNPLNGEFLDVTCFIYCCTPQGHSDTLNTLGIPLVLAEPWNPRS